MARIWRVYHPRPFAPDDDIVLSADEAHHVRQVLRLRVGDPLRVFDGCGVETEATLIECRADRVAVRAGSPLTDSVEPDLEVVLFQGMCRPERMEWVIQKATECGCRAIHPLAAAHGAGVRLTDQRLGRWRRVALEACKQSGRRHLPEVAPVDTLPVPGDDDLALLLDPGAGAAPLADRMNSPRPRAVWLAVGPESGFSREEIEAAVAGGWQATGLGPRVLRTETAGIAAAAIVLHRWADLGC